MKIIVIVDYSPFCQDDNLPWEYSGIEFQWWVYEVLLDNGKAGKFPKSISDAVEIATAAKYQVKVIVKQKPKQVVKYILMPIKIIERENEIEMIQPSIKDLNDIMSRSDMFDTKEQAMHQAYLDRKK
jgi:hypothetical protein